MAMEHHLHISANYHPDIFGFTLAILQFLDREGVMLIPMLIQLAIRMIIRNGLESTILCVDDRCGPISQQIITYFIVVFLPTLIDGQTI